LNATTFEIGRVACRQQCAMHADDRGNLSVHFCDWPSLRASLCRDLRKCTRGLFIESENVSGEVFREHAFGLGAQLVAPFAWRKDLNSVENLSHRDGGDENSVGTPPVRYPSEDALGRRRSHRLGEHIRVQDGHVLLPDSGIANRAARWNLEVHAAQRRESSADGRDQVFSRLLGLAQRSLQDLAGFLLHRASMAGRAHSELALGAFFELSDSDASHDINDSTDVNDGTSKSKVRSQIEEVTPVFSASPVLLLQFDF